MVDRRERDWTFATTREREREREHPVVAIEDQRRDDQLTTAAKLLVVTEKNKDN